MTVQNPKLGGQRILRTPYTAADWEREREFISLSLSVRVCVVAKTPSLGGSWLAFTAFWGKAQGAAHGVNARCQEPIPQPWARAGLEMLRSQCFQGPYRTWTQMDDNVAVVFNTFGT